ncbi:carbohydrate kinase family protein [Inquilinus sp. Marseille-Q2685]|uniref:carbohydrate kinase family protein n=1 Tax=Inquilinus sp. Marseille-Q2685 TaxID=2866581 RepID=UPI001CE439BC|nr:carbohydrate kinase family protein [Inquilinus sp. Marseille-Q2685]
MERSGIICGGTICIDVNKVIDRFPPQEHVARIREEMPDCGGPGLNMAIDLARLGAPFPIEVIGIVGDDAYGRIALDTCRELGIGAGRIAVVPGGRTSYTDVMIVAEGGRRTFFHQEGVNAQLSTGHFDLAGSTAKIFHVGSPGVHARMDVPQGNGNGFSEVLARAKATGHRTNLELVGVAGERLRDLALPCLPLLDSIIINESEATALTGVETHRDGRPDWALVEAAAAALIRMGVFTLAVVHFPDGVVAADRAGRLWRQGAAWVPPEKVKSTNGAGDALASGVMLGLHEGWPVEKGLRLGVCVAALSLGSYSTSRAIPSAEECFAYGERAGFKPTS